MLVFEIPLVLLTGSGLKRIGARGLLIVGVLAGGIRWFLSAVTDDFMLLFAVQALHGVTVVGLNLGSPLYLDAVAPEKLRSTAQGILSMVGAGVAGVASNLTAGWLMDRAGIDALYMGCGIGLLVLGASTALFLPGVEYQSQKTPEAVLPSDTPA
jgi:MFS transporter, PPP family, 3-phenylpropionic acid transporter